MGFEMPQKVQDFAQFVQYFGHLIVMKIVMKWKMGTVPTRHRNTPQEYPPSTCNYSPVSKLAQNWGITNTIKQN